MKKISHSLAFFLSVLIFLSSFSFSAFAASDNADGSSSFVEDTDLRNWQVDGVGKVTKVNGIYSFYMNPTDTVVDSTVSPSVTWYTHSFCVSNSSNIKSGNSYTIKFSIPSYETFSKIYFPNFSKDWYYSQFPDGSGTIFFNIGLGYLDNNGSFSYYDDYVVFLSKDDILPLLDKEYTYTFDVKDFKGATPYFGISIINCNNYQNSWFFIGQPQFIDESKAEEDGFFARLFQWFQEKFDNLKSWFSDLSASIGGFFDNLTDSIQSLFSSLTDSIKSLFSSLTDSIKAFFQGIGNLILYFDWNGDENYVNPFESVGGPLDIVGDLFDKIKDYFSDVTESITSVIDSVTAGIYIFDKFTERFKWVLGLCVFALAVIVISRFIGL